MNYETLGAEIGRLVDTKQAAYGDSFGKSGQVLRILYPNGISLEQLDDALAVVRVVDKLFRIATDKAAFGESPWKDVSGYGLLGAKRAEKKQEPPHPQKSLRDLAAEQKHRPYEGLHIWGCTCVACVMSRQAR